MFTFIEPGYFHILNCFNKRAEVFHSKNYMSCFGNDFRISDNCNLKENFNDLSELGSCYQLPDEIHFKSEQARSFLAGSNIFTVDEIEVF